MFSYSFTGVIVICITTIITCDFIHISTCTGTNSKVYPSTNLLTNMTYLGIMNRPDRAWKCQCGTVMPRLTYLRCTNCDADKNTGESLLHKKGDWSCPKCGCNNFAKRTKSSLYHKFPPQKLLRKVLPVIGKPNFLLCKKPAKQ